MIKDSEDNNLEVLGESVPLGASRTLNFVPAKLYTATKVAIPVIIERSKEKGPVVLLTAGIHGDEINGVEIVRQIIARGINKPKRGTIICIPVLNVFGFLSMRRYFPDGKDLNRVFPGSKKGSLASQFAYQFVHQILPHIDLCIDYHTGGASRFNAPQIRLAATNEDQLDLANVFNAPFTLITKNLGKTFRSICDKMTIPMLLFEGGKSKSSDIAIARHGVSGTLRVLNHLDMLDSRFEVPENIHKTVTIYTSFWVRAKQSGLLHIKVAPGQKVAKGQLLASITDPYGTMRKTVLSTEPGYIINVNESPMVYQGDAIFHIGRL